MCVDPGILNIGKLAMDVAGSFMQYRAESDYYDKASQAVNSGIESQSQQIMQRQQQQMAQMGLMQQQTDAAATDAMSDRARLARIEMGKLRAVAGESGLSGVSQKRAFGESKFNEGQDVSSIDANRLRQQAQLDMQGKGIMADNASQIAGIKAQGQSQINSLKKPSMFNAGMSIVGAGMNFGTRGLEIKRARKYP